MNWLMPVRIGERKKCENSLGDNSGILGICVNYYGRIMWMFCTYLCLVLLCIYYIFWLGSVQPWRYCVSFSLMCIFNTVTSGVKVHYNHLSVSQFVNTNTCTTRFY